MIVGDDRSLARMGSFVRMAVRAAGTAGRGTGGDALRQSLGQRAGQRLAHDLLDGAGTAAAFS